MKRKKIIIVTLVVLATLFGSKSLVLAQKSQEDKVQHITERMAKKLNLTQEQKEKVYTINLKKVEARQNLKITKSETSRKERKQQFKKDMVAWKNDLKTVLNEEQLKKMCLK